MNKHIYNLDSKFFAKWFGDQLYVENLECTPGHCKLEIKTVIPRYENIKMEVKWEDQKYTVSVGVEGHGTYAVTFESQSVETEAKKLYNVLVKTPIPGFENIKTEIGIGLDWKFHQNQKSFASVDLGSRWGKFGISFEKAGKSYNFEITTPYGGYEKIRGEFKKDGSKFFGSLELGSLGKGSIAIDKASAGYIILIKTPVPAYETIKLELIKGQGPETTHLSIKLTKNDRHLFTFSFDIQMGPNVKFLFQVKQPGKMLPLVKMGMNYKGDPRNKKVDITWKLPLQKSKHANGGITLEYKNTENHEVYIKGLDVDIKLVSSRFEQQPRDGSIKILANVDGEKADIDLTYQGAHTNSPNVKITAAVGDSQSFPTDKLTINLKLISEDTKKALRFFLDGFDHKADISLSVIQDETKQTQARVSVRMRNYLHKDSGIASTLFSSQASYSSPSPSFINK